MLTNYILFPKLNCIVSNSQSTTSPLSALSSKRQSMPLSLPNQIQKLEATNKQLFSVCVLGGETSSWTSYSMGHGCCVVRNSAPYPMGCDCCMVRNWRLNSVLLQSLKDKTAMKLDLLNLLVTFLTFSQASSPISPILSTSLSFKSQRVQKFFNVLDTYPTPTPMSCRVDTGMWG